MTDKTPLRKALHDLEGQLPCSNEDCACCKAIWPRVERVLELLAAQPIKRFCTETVVTASEPIPSQYNGEKVLTSHPCNRVLPCEVHTK